MQFVADRYAPPALHYYPVNSDVRDSYESVRVAGVGNLWEKYEISQPITRDYCNFSTRNPHEIRTCTYMEPTRNPHETRTCTNMEPTRNPHKIRTFTQMEPTRNPYMYPYMEPTRNP